MIRRLGKGNLHMGYIEELRKVVGTRPLILVGSAIIILNDNQEVLSFNIVQIHMIGCTWWGDGTGRNDRRNCT